MIRIRVSRNRWAQVAAEVPARAAVVVAETALDIESDATQRAPVRTGNLRRSIHHAIDTPHHATVGTNVEYAPYVEYGTSRMAAQPYLTPAVEAARPRFRERLRNIFR